MSFSGIWRKPGKLSDTDRAGAGSVHEPKKRIAAQTEAEIPIIVFGISVGSMCKAPRKFHQILRFFLKKVAEMSAKVYFAE